MSLAKPPSCGQVPATAAAAIARATETSINSLLLTTITMSSSLDNTNDFIQRKTSCA